MELLHVQPEGGVRPAGPPQRLALSPAALLRKEPRPRFCETRSPFLFFFCLSLFDLIFNFASFFGATFQGGAEGLPACHGGEEEAHPGPVTV